MKLFKKAMIRGVTAVVIIYILVLALQAVVGLWEPIVEIVNIHNSTLKTMASLGLTIVATALVGYIIILAHPFRIVFNKILKIRARKAKGVVFVEWGGLWFYGWITGTLEVDGEILYRITIPGAPAPVAGHLTLAPRERIKFVDVALAEHLAQLASMGFGPIREKIGTRVEPDLVPAPEAGAALQETA
jgi:hypothetical protein